MRAQKYKTEAETFGWSFVFHDFVSEELKSKVTEKIEVFRLYSTELLRKSCYLLLVHCYNVLVMEDYTASYGPP